MWPRSPGQHKENILLLPLVGDLGVWIRYSHFARLHKRRRCWHTGVGQLERWRRAWTLVTLLSAMLRTVTFPTRSCLGIKYMLREGVGRKEGCKMINSASYTNVFGWSMERVLERIKAGSEGSWEVCCKVQWGGCWLGLDRKQGSEAAGVGVSRKGGTNMGEHSDPQSEGSACLVSMGAWHSRQHHPLRQGRNRKDRGGVKSGVWLW